MLRGRETDLATLARHFREGDVRVSQGSDGTYHLAATVLTTLWDNGLELQACAERLLRQANGAVYVLESAFQPVTLVARFSNEAVPGHIVAVNAVEEISMASAVTISINGLPQSSRRSHAQELLRSAAEHPDVAEVLALLGGSGAAIGWVDLYKVYEIIGANVGSHDDNRSHQAALAKKGWKSKKELDAFRASANLPSVSGEAARHARATNGTPAGTMTLTDGRAMINDLVATWSDWLGSRL